MPDESPILTAVDRHRAEVLAENDAALMRVAKAYADIYKRLQREVDALVLQLQNEGQLSREDLLKASRYKILMQQTADELTKFTGYLQVEVNNAAGAGIDLGSVHGREMISQAIAGNASLTARFAVLPKATIESLLGFLSPDSPLYQRISELAPFTAEQVTQTIMEGVGIGRNPRVIAREIEAAYGQGLTNAMRMVRTVQLWSYREASRSTYVVNQDVVQGWYWHAELNRGTCLSCINQHGSFHPLTETLNDHHNGRCAMIPAVKGFPPPVQEGAGEAWFKEQPQSIQRQMMGKGRYDAWLGRKFEFGQLTAVYQDDIYGQMKRETPLKDLLRRKTAQQEFEEAVGKNEERDLFAGIRPPSGVAPRGMGQEYADRRAIESRITTQLKYRSQVQNTINNYRGTKADQYSMSVYRTRLQELNKGIDAALKVANGEGDWALKRELISGIIEYVSAITR